METLNRSNAPLSPPAALLLGSRDVDTAQPTTGPVVAPGSRRTCGQLASKDGLGLSSCEVGGKGFKAPRPLALIPALGLIVDFGFFGSLGAMVGGHFRVLFGWRSLPRLRKAATSKNLGAFGGPRSTDLRTVEEVLHLRGKSVERRPSWLECLLALQIR